jgi:predicted nucleotide-binding protein
MHVDDAKRLLTEAGIQVHSEERLGNDTGMQLRCDGDSIVNLYDSGSVVVQGKNQKRVREVLNVPAAARKPAGGTTIASAKTQVFVVYGHDSSARTQLEAMLRRWGLEPLILDQLPSEGQTIIEKLESYTSEVGFAVVLATPDDEGNRVDHADEKAFRARQNVVLELGMMLSKLGRKRVAILIKQSEKMERPSDIQGLIYVPFKEDVKETQVVLAKEMSAQGYKISVSNL